MCAGEFTLIFSSWLILVFFFFGLEMSLNISSNALIVKLLLQEDIYYPHTLIQDLFWDGLYIFTEPLLTRWPFNKLVREKALQVTMKHIHYEDENSRYITIGCVEKVM